MIFQTSASWSFLAVSTPIFASKFSFYSNVRDLQDVHSFAPLQSQSNLASFRQQDSTCLLIFSANLKFRKILGFLMFSPQTRLFSGRFWWNVLRISRTFPFSHEYFQTRSSSDFCQNKIENIKIHPYLDKLPIFWYFGPRRNQNDSNCWNILTPKSAARDGALDMQRVYADRERSCL